MQPLTQFVLFLVLIIVIGSVDCGKQINHLMILSQREKTLQSELADSSRSIKPDHLIMHTKDELMESFLYQAKKSGLILQSISSTQFSRDDMLNIRVLLQGGFPEIIHFFANLEQACFPFLLKQLSLTAEHANLNAALELTLFGVCEKNQTKIVMRKNFNDPFVASLDDFSLLEKKRNHMLKDFSIRQMHLAGYLNSSVEMLALVMLPDGETVEVRKGDALGRENTLVTEVNTHYLRMLRGHQYIDLTSEY